MLLISHSSVQSLVLSTVLLTFPFCQSLMASPNNLDRIMYFNANIRDAEFCRLDIAEGEVSFGKNVTHPAITCPDAYSWFLFSQVVHDGFWMKWSDDAQNWPPEPWPLCRQAKSAQCCDPVRYDNDVSHCPLFPGDVYSDNLQQVLDEQHGMSKNTFISRFPHLVRVGTVQVSEPQPALSLHSVKGLPGCTTEQIWSVLPDDTQSISRILVQAGAQVVYRNRSFTDYLFANNLYNADGVLDVFLKNRSNQNEGAPYHLENHSAAGRTLGDLARIDFPPDAIMMKANWISESVLQIIKEKFPSASDYFGQADEYIHQPMVTVFKREDREPLCTVTGVHYLLGFHISAKSIPQWAWSTFEHNKNPGRCDDTGCNDSFGYLVLNNGKPTNFIKPFEKSDHQNVPKTVFSREAIYPDGHASKELRRLFRFYDVAKRLPLPGQLIPDRRDMAWANYRLRSSQVDFTDLQGRATFEGNSVIEAGFVKTSSCITCHARAGVSVKTEKRQADFFKLQIFSPELSEYGYQQSSFGIPQHGWFYGADSKYTLQVLQTDFIWGFLLARPLVSRVR